MITIVCDRDEEHISMQMQKRRKLIISSVQKRLGRYDDTCAAPIPNAPLPPKKKKKNSFCAASGRTFCKSAVARVDVV